MSTNTNYLCEATDGGQSYVCTRMYRRSSYTRTRQEMALRSLTSKAAHDKSVRHNNPHAQQSVLASENKRSHPAMCMEARGTPYITCGPTHGQSHMYAALGHVHAQRCSKVLQVQSGTRRGVRHHPIPQVVLGSTNKRSPPAVWTEKPGSTYVCGATHGRSPRACIQPWYIVYTQKEISRSSVRSKASTDKGVRHNSNACVNTDAACSNVRRMEVLRSD